MGKSKPVAPQVSSANAAATHRREIFAKVRRGTVAIVPTPAFGPEAPLQIEKVGILGSGFFAAKDIVVTAGHVVDEWVKAAEAKGDKLNTLSVLMHGDAKHQGNQFSWEYTVIKVAGIRRDKNHDIALLKLAPNDKESEIHPLRCCPEPPREGDAVATCGYPFGRDLHSKLVGTMPAICPSFCEGIVSAVLPHSAAPKPQLVLPFQIQMSISGGNSGGPLFNPASGEVVGIVTHRHEQVVKFPTGGKVKPPTGSGAPSAEMEEIAELKLPTGLALAEHIHHALAGINF